MSNSKKLVGEWDFANDDCRIGSMFMYIVQLNVLYPQAGCIRLFNSDGKTHLVDLFHAFSQHQIILSGGAGADTGTYNPALSHNPTALAESAKTGSFLWLGKLLGENGLATLGFPGLAEEPAVTHVTRIAVHLKNVPHDPLSNANQAAWHSFFKRVGQSQPEIRFQLIGDDEIDKSILDLPNVEKRRGSITDYFKAALEAAGFLGMASAFSSAAILSSKPYRIWKHTGHHSDEMLRELDGTGQFSFHLDNQKFIIGEDSVNAIEQEFALMLATMKA